MVLGVGTILGGLPVVVDVEGGYDSWTMEGYSEVQAIYWLRKGDKPGKELPQHIVDRALKYDPLFCNLMEQAWDWIRDHRELEDPEPPPEYSLDWR